MPHVVPVGGLGLFPRIDPQAERTLFACVSRSTRKPAASSCSQQALVVEPPVLPLAPRAPAAVGAYDQRSALLQHPPQLAERDRDRPLVHVLQHVVQRDQVE